MKKKILSIGLLSLLLVSAASCGEETEGPSSSTDDSIIVTTTVDAEKVAEAKESLTNYYEQQVRNLGISSSNNSEYYNQLRSIFDEGIEKLDEAQTITALNNALSNYRNRIRTKTSEIQTLIETQELLAYKSSAIKSLEQYSAKLLTDENMIADDIYDARLLEAKSLIEAAQQTKKNVDSALESAKTIMSNAIIEMKSASGDLQTSQNNAVTSLIEYANEKLKEKNLVDDGSIYKIISTNAKTIYTLGKNLDILNQVNAGKTEIDRGLNGTIDQSLAQYVKGEVIIANKLTVEGTEIPCINTQTTANQIYAKCLTYLDELAKEFVYNDEFKTDAKVEINSNYGLSLNDSSIDDKLNNVYGSAVESYFEFGKLTSEDTDTLTVHFDLGAAASGNWMFIEFQNEKGNRLFELGNAGSSGNMRFGYRYPSTADRVTIGTIKSNDVDDQITVDLTYNFDSKQMVIKLTKGSTIEETAPITTDITEIARMKFSTHKDARSVTIKNFVASKEANGTHVVDLTATKTNAKNELEAYADELLKSASKEDDGTVIAEVNNGKNNIDSADSDSAIQSALSTAKQAVETAVNNITKEENPVAPITLTSSSLEATSQTGYSENYKVNDTFTILSTTDKPARVDGTPQRINLSKGKATSETNGIQITATKACVVQFIASATKNSYTAGTVNTPAKAASAVENNFVLLNTDNTVYKTSTEYALLTDTTNVLTTVYSMTIDEAGTYILGGASSGIYIYSITVDYSDDASEIVIPDATLIENYNKMFTNYALTVLNINSLSENAEALAKKAELEASISSTQTAASAKAAYETAKQELLDYLATLSV